MRRSEEGRASNGRAGRMRLRDDNHIRERRGGIPSFGDRQAKEGTVLNHPPPVLLIEQKIHVIMMKSTRTIIVH